MNPIPSIPKDLVDFLDALYSADKMAPRESDSERKIWINVGKRELVEKLIQMRKDQETGADEGLPDVLLQSTAGLRGGPDDHASPGDPGPSAGTPGPYASPQDRLGRLR
jgi:hypothetical protein